MYAHTVRERVKLLPLWHTLGIPVIFSPGVRSTGTIHELAHTPTIDVYAQMVREGTKLLSLEHPRVPYRFETLETAIRKQTQVIRIG